MGRGLSSEWCRPTSGIRDSFLFPRSAEEESKPQNSISRPEGERKKDVSLPDTDSGQRRSRRRRRRRPASVPEAAPPSPGLTSPSPAPAPARPSSLPLLPQCSPALEQVWGDHHPQRFLPQTPGEDSWASAGAPSLPPPAQHSKPGFRSCLEVLLHGCYARRSLNWSSWTVWIGGRGAEATGGRIRDRPGRRSWGGWMAG